MAKLVLSTELTPEQLSYVGRIRKRVRWSDLGMNLRAVSRRVVWVTVLVAGAAVTLSEALSDLSWLPAVLGFVIVVGQGADRLFGRDTSGVQAMETMRRALSKELRLFSAAAGPYGEEGATFTLFAERCERVLDAYDASSISHVGANQGAQTT